MERTTTQTYEEWVKSWKEKAQEKAAREEMKKEIESNMVKVGKVWTDEPQKTHYVLGTEYAPTTKEIVIAQTEYTRKEYPAENVDNYIVSCYAAVTKTVVKCMARAEMARYQKCDHVESVYMPCYEIVKSGFQDFIFEDLAQEIACFLCENKNKLAPCSILKTKQSTFALNELFIDCFAIIQRYLYREKQRHEKRLYVVTDCNEYTQNDIIDVLGSIPERQNALDNKEFSVVLDTFSRLLIKYAKTTKTTAQCEKFLTVWAYMTKYATQKQIAAATGYSKNTVGKYRDEIISCWESFKKYNDNHAADGVNISDFQTMLKNSLYEMAGKLERKAREKLDFSGPTKHYDIDITISEISAHHAEMSKFYNDIFTRSDRMARQMLKDGIYNE